MPMIELAALSPTTQAALLVTIILIEAVVLYVGYGAVERFVAPPLMETIEDA